MSHLFLLFTFCLCLLSCTSKSQSFSPTQQEKFVDPNEKLIELWANGIFTEGPTVDEKGNILFTDIRVNRIMKYNPESKQTTIFKENSNGSNGLYFINGSLYACEGAGLQKARVTRTDKNSKETILADNWQGAKLNSPNDLCITKQGNIYFTDPRYGSTKGKELDFEGVFLIKNNKLILATKETERPNGILISHDEKHLYVADNNNQNGGARDLLKFDIAADGTLKNKQILFSFNSSQRGIDGMAMDSEGNIYATAGKGPESGIYIFSPNGEHLALIELPDKPTNCTFGGDQSPNTLYITCQVRRQPHQNKKFGLFKINLKKR